MTLTAGVTAVEEIWDHLKNDIGFAEVGFSPVTSGDMTAFNLSGDELLEVFEGLKSLGRRYHSEAREGRNIGFSNMHQLMQDLWEGRSKALPCGAGIGMLAVDRAGNLSGACTTSGAAYKYHGRVGDSPIIGAGLYVDNEVGGATATGWGEAVIRAVGCFLVVELMRQGHGPAEACELAVERVIEKNPDWRDIQVGFLALSKTGEVGSFCIAPGFNYAVYRPEDGNRLIDAPSRL